jgi:hypothetical protein
MRTKKNEGGCLIALFNDFCFHVLGFQCRTLLGRWHVRLNSFPSSLDLNASLESGEEKRERKLKSVHSISSIIDTLTLRFIRPLQ